MSGEWHRMSALALGAGIEGGAIDPRALTEFFLERIEEVDGDHAIYLRLTAARARAEAEAEAAHRRAQIGLRHSPLDGVPISWKDLYDSAGDVTSHGTPGAGGPCRNRRRKGSGPRHPSWPGVPGQDEPDRVRLLHPRSEPQDGHPGPTPSTRPSRVYLAGRLRAPPFPSRAASPLPPSVRTRAAPCVCRRPGTASSD